MGSARSGELIEPGVADGHVVFQLKWKCEKEDGSQGGYSRDVLLRLLQKVDSADICHSLSSQTRELRCPELLFSCPSRDSPGTECSCAPLASSPALPTPNPFLKTQALAACVEERRWLSGMNAPSFFLFQKLRQLCCVLTWVLVLRLSPRCCPVYLRK